MVVNINSVDVQDEDFFEDEFDFETGSIFDQLSEEEAEDDQEEEEPFVPIEVPSLLSLSLRYLQSRTTGSQLEHVLVKGCPRHLYAKLLASTLIHYKPRPLFTRILLKHWPKAGISLEYLASKCPRFSEVYLKEPERMSSIGIGLLETYFHSLGYVSKSTLKCFDFQFVSKRKEFQLKLRHLLNTYYDLICDWVMQNKAAHLKVYVNMHGNEETAFWTKFLTHCGSFVEIVGVSADSPLASGSPNAMKLLMKILDTSEVNEFHLFGERLFNRGGSYETEVDHLKEIMFGMYRHEIAPWQTKLKAFEHITSLSLCLPSKTPACEFSGQIKIQERELRRISPTAIKAWSSVLPHLRSLKKLSLRGNYLRHTLEHLLRNVPFSLQSLNVEECCLSSKDLQFLAISPHHRTLTEINLGDLDLGDDRFGHILGLVKVIPRLESLGLCLEGYERYADNICINEYQALDLLSALCQVQNKSLKQINLGGHIWSKETLLKYIKYLFPIPTLQSVTLPVDGLNPDSLKQYFFAKMADVSCLPPLEISEYGPEFKELKIASQVRMKPWAVEVKTKALRDGAQFVFTKDIKKASKNKPAVRRKR